MEEHISTAITLPRFTHFSYMASTEDRVDYLQHRKFLANSYLMIAYLSDCAICISDSFVLLYQHLLFAIRSSNADRMANRSHLYFITYFIGTPHFREFICCINTGFSRNFRRDLQQVCIL